jgi:outer membrane protein OmpA-like peptidoglycan-associated protein
MRNESGYRKGVVAMSRANLVSLLKTVALIGLLVVLDGCVTGSPSVATREWSVPLEGTQPVRDAKRDGYWWTPSQPPEGVADKDAAWGNRGTLYRAWERKRPQEPAVVVAEAPVPEPPVTFAMIPELAPVKIEKVTVRERIVLDNVLFDLDKAELKPEGKSKVEKAAGYLKEYRTDRAVVEGHACTLGTEEHNLDLAMRRADTVKRYLVETGIEPARIRTISYGESQPIADNSTEDGRELNRRVVMEIVEGK